VETEESLHERYSNLETFDLLEIFKNKSGFTELAVSVAYKELKHRKVSEEEIRNYQPILINKIDETIIHNGCIDLKFFYKVLFYIIFIPKLRYHFTYNLRPNGYLLKLTQSNYYSVAGFAFMLLASLIVAYLNIPFFAMWTPGFIIAYLFDICFNRERQIREIKKVIQQGEMPWGY
jgi:hypothetical protein